MFFNELTSKFSDRFLIAFNESSLAIILGECINSFLYHVYKAVINSIYQHLIENIMFGYFLIS